MGRLVDAARKYIDVKWRHRGRTRHGLDCAGLGVLAYRDCGVELPDFVLYSREPHNDGLIKYLTAALGDPLPTGSSIEDGDVLVMRFNKEPHHVAIAAMTDYGGTPALNVVHANGQAGRVLEQRLGPEMAERITHVYRKRVL